MSTTQRMSADTTIAEFKQTLLDVGQIKSLVERQAVRYILKESHARQAYLKRRKEMPDFPANMTQQASDWLRELESLSESACAMLAREENKTNSPCIASPQR